MSGDPRLLSAASALARMASHHGCFRHSLMHDVSAVTAASAADHSGGTAPSATIESYVASEKLGDATILQMCGTASSIGTTRNARSVAQSCSLALATMSSRAS